MGRSSMADRSSTQLDLVGAAEDLGDADESSNTARRPFAISGAIDSTFSLSNVRSSGIGTVFVTTTCSIGASSKD